MELEYVRIVEGRCPFPAHADPLERADPDYGWCASCGCGWSYAAPSTNGWPNVNVHTPGGKMPTFDLPSTGVNVNLLSTAGILPR